MRSLGLIEVFKMERNVGEFIGAHVLLYYVTELGFDFWFACNAPPPRSCERREKEGGKASP